MDAKRAREIAASPDMVDVRHDGDQIYIESVMNDSTAMVHTLNNPNNRMRVRISDLIER